MRSDFVVIPHALVPTNGFHRLVTRELPERAFDGELSRTPYPVLLSDDQAALITSVTCRLYPLGLQVVRISAEMKIPHLSDIDALFTDLQVLRKPHSVKVANHVIREALTLATGHRESSPQEVSYSTFFGMQITLPIEKQALYKFATRSHARQIVGLLIGDKEIGSLSPRIIKRIAQRNERLNEKSSYEYVVTNRGGLIQIVPDIGYVSPHPNRFERALDLSELACFAAAFLDYAGEERLIRERLVYFLLARVRRWIEAPNVVFPTSTTNQLHWDVLADSLALRDSLVEWERSNGPESTDMKPLWRKVPTKWWQIPDFANALDRLRAEPSQLAFIKDTDMRLFVESEVAEARRCFATGNNKAALVMAGASVEAILLALLEDGVEDKRRAALRRMELGKLINEASPDWRETEANPPVKRLISKNVAAMLDTSCRQWRNLIHPGKAIRENVEVTPTMAEAALAALNLVIEEARRNGT